MGSPYLGDGSELEAFVEPKTEGSMVRCNQDWEGSGMGEPIIGSGPRHSLIPRLRGPGGGVFYLAKAEISFSDRGECQLPDPFYWIK